MIEACQLSQSVHYDNKGQQSRRLSRRKSYPIDVLLRPFVEFSVAAAATIYQEPHFCTRLSFELKDKSLHFCFDPEIFHVWIHFNTWSNLTQGIQFREFVGESNCMLTPISMHFINLVPSLLIGHPWLCVISLWHKRLTCSIQSRVTQARPMLCEVLLPTIYITCNTNSTNAHAVSCGRILASYPIFL